MRSKNPSLHNNIKNLIWIIIIKKHVNVKLLILDVSATKTLVTTTTKNYIKAHRYGNTPPWCFSRFLNCTKIVPNHNKHLPNFNSVCVTCGYCWSRFSEINVQQKRRFENFRKTRRKVILAKLKDHIKHVVVATWLRMFSYKTPRQGFLLLRWSWNQCLTRFIVSKLLLQVAANLKACLSGHLLSGRGYQF